MHPVCTVTGHSFFPSTSFSFIASCYNGFLCLLVCASHLALKSFPLHPNSPGSSPPGAQHCQWPPPMGLAWGRLPVQSASPRPPSAWSPLLWESTGPTWGGYTSLYFLSLSHPKSMRHSSPHPPSPESFLFPRPGPSRTHNARGQSATFQWLHRQGGFWIPSWGVGVGQEGRQRGRSSAEEDSAGCTHDSGTKVMGQWSQQGPPEVPPEQVRSGHSISSGLKKEAVTCRHTVKSSREHNRLLRASVPQSVKQGGWPRAAFPRTILTP